MYHNANFTATKLSIDTMDYQWYVRDCIGNLIEVIHISWEDMLIEDEYLSKYFDLHRDKTDQVVEHPCKGCIYFYGGPIICAVHPEGPQEEYCRDKEVDGDL